MAKRKAKVVAVLGRSRRVGRWTVSRNSVVVAVFGACHLDLTRAEVEDDTEDLSLTVFALFGSVSILLPEGSVVLPSGMAIAASTVFDLASTGEATALAPIDLEWTACLARVRVTELVTEEAGAPAAALSGVEASPGATAPPKVPDQVPDVVGEVSPESEPVLGNGAPKTASITEGIPRPVPGPLRPKTAEAASG